MWRRRVCSDAPPASIYLLPVIQRVSGEGFRSADRKGGKEMEGSKDYYRMLGIPEDAAEEEIKAAYRRLAKKYHPDAHPGDEKCEAMFREVNEAYDVLGDARKRKAYDGERHRAERTGSFRSERTGDSHSAGDSRTPGERKVDFENIHKSFAQFFGFDPRTQNITDEEKLKGRSGNPLDTTEMFERFMGIKR